MCLAISEMDSSSLLGGNIAKFCHGPLSYCGLCDGRSSKAIKGDGSEILISEAPLQSSTKTSPKLMKNVWESSFPNGGGYNAHR